MNAISEAELTDFIQNKAVKRMYIIQGANARYQIIVTLTWKPDYWNLVNAKKKPRQWASLDRLARHIINEYGGDLPTINLVLYSEEREGTITVEINDISSEASLVPAALHGPTKQLESKSLIQKERRIFAYNFKRARKETGITQAQLEKQTGLTQSFISSVENARSSINLDNANRLAEAIGQPLWKLLTPVKK